MQAYTDPGSGALIWQLTAAACIGLLFYLRKVASWLKARKRSPRD